MLLIDTDLTQPTLPTWLNGKVIDKSQSLGRVLNIGMRDIMTYMHQDRNKKGLFYSGLTENDNILSYEYGFDSTSFAQQFLDNCAQVVDHIVIDLSSQRFDTFLPCTLSSANKILLTMTPDTKGILRHNSYDELIDQFNVTNKVYPIAMQEQSFHDIKKIEQNTGIKFYASIPYLKSIAMCADNKKGLSDIPKLNKQVKAILKALEVNDSE